MGISRLAYKLRDEKIITGVQCQGAMVPETSSSYINYAFDQK